MSEIAKPMRDLLDIIRFTESLSAKIAVISDEDTLYSVLDTEFKRSPYSSSILLLTDDGSKLRFALASLPGKGLETAEKIAGFSIKDYRVDLKKSRFFSQIVFEGKTVYASHVEMMEALLPRTLRLTRTLISKIPGISDADAVLTPLYRNGNAVGIFSMSSAELAEEFTPSVKSLARHIESAMERVEDLAERKRIEKEKRISEEEYRSLVENSKDSIVMVDMKGNVIFGNRATQELTGYTVEEGVGMNVRDITPSRYWPRNVEMLLRATTGKPIPYFESVIKRKDGRLVPVESGGHAIVRDGRVVGIQIITRDISERKRAEEALRESEEKHRTLFETMAQGAVYQDADGRITSANPAAERILGLSIEQMQGRTSVDPRWKAIHEDGSDFPGETRPSMVALRTGKEVRNVVMGVFNPQAEKHSWININAVPQFRPGDTKPFRVYTTFEDITERRDMERQLRENAERLEELVEERTKELRETERLATIGQTALMVGHDLRNPLQALMNSLYLFKEFLDKAPPEIGELARRRGLEMASNAEEQIVYMNKIISDLAYYASPGHVEPVEAELPKIIKESLELTTIPTSVVVSVEAHMDLAKPEIDVAMIRRVFANLITNAVQAMPNGGLLTIRASRVGESVFVSFSDTGVGIAKENMGKLFKPFFTTKAQGVGLGLPVCKRLVEAHGGEITIESEEGRKTTVTVKIPLKIPSTAP